MDRKLLYKFLKCETSHQEDALIADWLEASPEHRRELDDLQDAMENMVLSGIELRDLWTGHNRRSKIRKFAVKSAAVAAVVLVAAATSFSVVSNILSGLEKQRIVVEVPSGQHVSMMLADGSRVWLNSGTKLEYPSVFARNQRRVRLNGEAMFDVEHDAGRAFIVETFACEVEALGTKFNVCAYENKSVFSASLLSGRLKVTMLDSTGEHVILSPGETAALADGSLRFDTLSDHDEFLWVDGLLNLNNLTFEEVMNKFELYYGINIVMDMPYVPQTRFKGKLRIASGVEYALQSLQLTSDFSYVKDEQTNTIYIR